MGPSSLVTFLIIFPVTLNLTLFIRSLKISPSSENEFVYYFQIAVYYFQIAVINGILR